MRYIKFSDRKKKERKQHISHDPTMLCKAWRPDQADTGCTCLLFSVAMKYLRVITVPHT
jgi:hypothetical protein